MTGPGTAVVEQKPTLRGMLIAAKSKIEDVLPKHMNADKMIRVAMLATIKQPKLLECAPETVVFSVMQAASLGLEVGGTLNEAALVPYYNGRKKRLECQLIPMYRGLTTLAYRSGKVALIDARLVYPDDLFIVNYGTSPEIVHRPEFASPRRNIEDIIAAYCTVHMIGSPVRHFDVLTIAEVNALRARSKAKEETGPWTTDFGEMAKKSVVRRTTKMLPLSPEFADAIELDTRAEVGEITSVSARLLDTDESIAAEVGAKTSARASALREKLEKDQKSLTPDEVEEMRRQDEMDGAV